MEVLHENSQSTVKYQKVFFRNAGIDLVLNVQRSFADSVGDFQTGLGKGKLLTVTALPDGVSGCNIAKIYQLLNLTGFERPVGLAVSGELRCGQALGMVLLKIYPKNMHSFHVQRLGPFVF